MFTGLAPRSSEDIWCRDGPEVQTDKRANRDGTHPQAVWQADRIAVHLGGLRQQLEGHGFQGQAYEQYRLWWRKSASRALSLCCGRQKAINIKFPLQPHKKYYITQYEELGFHRLLRCKMITLPILTTSLIHFLFRRLGECTFWTWVKGL